MKVLPWRSPPSEQWVSWQCRAQQLYSPVSAPVEFTSCNRLCWLKCLILKDSWWERARDGDGLRQTVAASGRWTDLLINFHHPTYPVFPAPPVEPATLVLAPPTASDWLAYLTGLIHNFWLVHLLPVDLAHTLQVESPNNCVLLGSFLVSLCSG